MSQPEAQPQVSPHRLYRTIPAVWQLLAPRKALLACGLVLMAINRIASLVLPASTKWLIDDVINKRRTELLWLLLSIVLLAAIVQGITSLALVQSLPKEGQRVIAELRRKLHAHISRLPVAYYDATKTGTLVSRIMQDVEGVRNLLGTGLIDFAGGLLTSLVALVVLLRISLLMTGLAVLFLGFYALAINRALKAMGPIFRDRSKINAEVTGRLTESLGGVRVVKGYYAEEREQAIFSLGVERLLQNALRTVTAISVMTLSSNILLGAVGAVIMYVGARQILGGMLTVGEFFTYTLFLGFVALPVMQVVSIGSQITEAIAGLERTRELLDERPENTDPRRVVLLPKVVGEVRFDDVCFAYQPAHDVLQDISFLAQPGTVTALVGPSGAGKSTIIGLIAAFHTASCGTVKIDGVDLATVRLESYRTRLGVVLQDSFLFEGTILENVAFSRPNASKERILEACRIARVDEFAESFDTGYDTVVGERGVKLSGGQRQRISIARAILADPRILILDEATSSLDSESEQLIQEGLYHLMQGRTTFVIAHRLSTIRRADQILVLEKGRIVERGKHAELLAAEGRYFELYMRQQDVESNLFLAPGEGDTVTQSSPEVKLDSTQKPSPSTILQI
jgi:ABC-type multidrug transport system fused ATPase/permease subunit